jgi:hypothetical protein
MATQQRSPSLFDLLTSAQQLWPGVISGAVPAHLVLTQLHTTQVSHEGAVLYNRLVNVITSRWQVYVKVMYRVLPSRTHTQVVQQARRNCKCFLSACGGVHRKFMEQLLTQ